MDGDRRRPDAPVTASLSPVHAPHDLVLKGPLTAGGLGKNDLLVLEEHIRVPVAKLAKRYHSLQPGSTMQRVLGGSHMGYNENAGEVT